jgi:hypothetical protein
MSSDEHHHRFLNDYDMTELFDRKLKLSPAQKLPVRYFMPSVIIVDISCYCVAYSHICLMVYWCLITTQ